MKRSYSFFIHTIAILFSEAFYLFIAWLLLQESLQPLTLYLSLFNLLLLAALLLYEVHRKRRQKQLFSNWQNAPEEALTALSAEAQDFAKTLIKERENAEAAAGKAKEELSSQREMAEAWIHEMKSPLFLLRLLLDNHAMEEELRTPLEHVQESLHSSIDKILVFSRLDSPHPDYFMEKLSLRELLAELLLEKQSFFQERGISVPCPEREKYVLSSRRELIFILRQLFSNACKYADSRQPQIKIELLGSEFTLLRLWNNGLSVPPEDLPFLFDKGFCGTQPQREKASGMGLYLAKALAEKLNLELSIEEHPPENEGFAIRLLFPA